MTEVSTEASVLESVTLYGKPACVQCNSTSRKLEKEGVPYEYVDLTEDLKAFTAVQELGFSQAPVLVVRVNGEDFDRAWSGYRPDLITDPLKAERASTDEV